MRIEELYEFLQSEKLGVLTTVAAGGTPQAALVGFAVTPELELIFDTVKSSRKYPNMKNNPHIAFVIGCAREITVQYEELRKSLREKH